MAFDTELQKMQLRQGVGTRADLTGTVDFFPQTSIRCAVNPGVCSPKGGCPVGRRLSRRSSHQMCC